MSGVDLSLDEFRGRYDLRPPPWTPPDLEKLTLGDMRILGKAPASSVLCGSPPKMAGGGIHTYLWVIDERGVAYILARDRPELGGRPPKHTNLTGGSMAYVGGEMWFETGSSLWISGDSGRYRPQSAVHLEDSAAVFRSFGYLVQSLGWDEETDSPNLILEES